jgi:hypothetical protein
VRQHRQAAQVSVVTSARRSHTEDIGVRQRRYVVMQVLRIVCVLLATMLPVALVWKGLFMLGAVALPWFGVVMANAGPSVSRRTPTALVDRPVQEPVRIALEPSRVIDADPRH